MTDRAMAQLRELKEYEFRAECLEVQKDESELMHYTILFKNNYVDGLDLLAIMDAGFRILEIQADNGVLHVTVKEYDD